MSNDFHPDKAITIIIDCCDMLDENIHDFVLGELLVNTYEALLEWLKNGGFKPTRWTDPHFRIYDESRIIALAEQALNLDNVKNQS